MTRAFYSILPYGPLCRYLYWNLTLMCAEASPTFLSSLKHLKHFTPPQVLGWCPCWMHRLFRDGGRVRQLTCFLSSHFPLSIQYFGNHSRLCTWIWIKKTKTTTKKAKNVKACTCPIFICYFQSVSYWWCFFRIPGASVFPSKVVPKPLADETNRFVIWRPQF